MSKKHGISEQTIYNWRQHFGGMDAADVKRLKQLEQENARLKKMLAERDLELDVMKEINAKNGERPLAVSRLPTRKRVVCRSGERAR